jgi:fibronectin-binding autotransporter adhesin
MSGRVRRRHLLATCSVLALAIGTADQARAGCTTNLGTSCANSGTVTYLYVSGAGNAAVTNTGTISPGGVTYGIGLYVKQGATVGAITNSGYIHGNNQSGIQIYGLGANSVTVASITNSGTIVAPSGKAIQVQGQVTVTGGITNSGKLSGYLGVFVGDGVSFSGGITNSGTIAGSATGTGINVYNPTSFAGGITNTRTGTISGKYAIYIKGVAGTVTNAGTITGTINSANDGAVSFLTAGSTLTNSGLIQNTGGGNAVVFRGGNDTLILGSRAQFVGNVVDLGTGNSLILSGVNFTNALAAQLTGFNFNNSPIVQGSGTNLSGTFNFTALTVQGGLTIDGSVTTGNVALGAGAALQVGDSATPTGALISNVSLTGGMLSGFGTVTGTVTNMSGTVAPGGTLPGTLTITGNYSQGANGSLSILATPSATSKLAVGGTASLAGALAVSASGSFANGARYEILTASTVSGTFATTSGLALSPLLGFTVSYSGDQVDLVAGAIPGLQSLATTPNQSLVAAALDQIIVANPAGFGPVITALANLTPAQVPQALDALGGAAQNYSGLAAAGLAGGQMLTTTIGQQLFQTHGAAFGGGALAQSSDGMRVQLASLDPLATLAQGPAPTRFASTSNWSAWLTGYGIFGDIGGNSNAHGLSYSTGGTAFGVDYRLDPSWLVGVFAGYAGTGTSSPGLSGSGSVDSYSFGTYASWAQNRLYVDAMLGYAYDADHLTRSIAFPGFSALTARGSTYGNQFLSSVETGRSYSLPDQFVATPFVGLQAVTLDQASFSETGAGVLDLAVNGQSTSSVRTQLGSRFSRDVELGEGHVVNLGLKLGWAHELSDTGTTTTASFSGAPGAAFAVQGAQRGRDSALVGVGVASKLDQLSSVYLRYDGDLNGPDNAHAVIGGIRLTW